MSQKVSMRKPSVALDIVDTVVWPFMVGDLKGVAEILDDASAVIPKYSSERKNVKGFKLACSINRERIHAALSLAQDELDKILSFRNELDTARWERLCGELEDVVVGVAGDQARGGELCDADYLIELVSAREDVLDYYRAAMCDEDVTRLANAVQERFLDEALLIEKRLQMFRDAESFMMRRMEVEVVRVSWPSAPQGISGAYLRALSWMFADLPKSFVNALTRDFAAPKLDTKAGDGVL